MDYFTDVITETGLITLAQLRAEKAPYCDHGQCARCTHAREVPGSAHIGCATPDADMTGNPHGIKEGWFMYPINFDPCWKSRSCKNYEPTTATAQSVTQSAEQSS